MTAQRCDVCGNDCDSLPGPDGVICASCQKEREMIEDFLFRRD